MDQMTCPQCQSELKPRVVGPVTVHRCAGCESLFLARADLGALVEAENDWHAHTGPHTEPLPRITADMVAPPPSRPKARSYLDTLFTG